MKRMILMSGFVAVVLSNSGCMSAAKRVLKEAKGASSKARTFPDSGRATYTDFKSISVSAPTSDVEPFISREFTHALPAELRKQLTEVEKAPFKGGEPVLHIEPKVLWYHEAGGVGGILGSDSYTVVLYTLGDGTRVMDRVQIVTKSAASRTGDDDMARSSAGSLAKWIQRRQKGRFDDVEDEEKDQEEQEERERERSRRKRD